MSWFKKKKSPEITKSILPKIIIGQKWVDRTWGDTIIEITAISLDGREVRYKHLQIEGQPNIHPGIPVGIYNTSRNFLFSNYKLIDF